MSDSGQTVESAAASSAGQIPARHCPKCDAEMQHLATLREAGRFPLQQFFRCVACRAVEMIDAT